MKICLYHILLISIIIFCLSPTNSNAQVNDDEAIELYPSFRHRSVINTVVISYYKNDEFYLPIGELFNALQIDYSFDASNGSIVVKGRYLKEETPYELNLTNLTAKFGRNSFQLTQDDFLIGELDYYFTPEVFQKMFDLSFEVDLNNLSITLESIKTLPIIAKYLRLQKRQRIRDNTYAEKNYPVRFNRETDLFNGGFLDYNLTNAYVRGTNLFTYSATSGFELAGGDLQGSMIGSISENFNSFETNNLRWRYAIRENPLITSLTVGQTRSDGLLGDAYTGIRITNDPIEPRRLFDEFRIDGNTIPESEVELYLNNVLVDFETANGVGDYNFLVPLTYGNSKYDVRIFGPTGQVQEISKNIQIPFTFTPPGEINYQLNAGQLDFRQIGSLEKDYIFNGDVSAGLTNWLSAKVGTEYYKSFDGKPTYKASLSSRLLSKYLLLMEYASDAYIRSSANVVYANSASLGITYTSFLEDFNIYNLSQDKRQIIINGFMPYKFFGLPANFRVSTFARIRENLNNTRFKVETAVRKNRLSFRLSYSDNYIGSFTPFEPTQLARIQNSITFSIPRSSNLPKFLKGAFLRTQLTYLPSLDQFEEAEFFISRNIFKRGRIQLVGGRNFLTGFNNFGFNLVFDFNKVRSNTSIRTIRSNSTYSQNLRGSVGFDSNYGNLMFTGRQQVGRAGTAIRLFVDNNSNGVFDEGDDQIEDNAVRIDRAGANSYTRDGVSYFTLLQPYFKYNMEVIKSNIKNPMLVPQIDKFALITDPNQFKSIEIPFYLSGVIEGKVERWLTGNRSIGIAGLKLLLINEGGETFQELRTFSDGSFYSYEVPPGSYELKVDPGQLNLLNVKTSPGSLNFDVKALPEGDFVEGLNIVLYPENIELDSLQIDVSTIIVELESSSEILEYDAELRNKVDQTLRLIVQAQNAFYSRNIDQALDFVNQSLAIYETAQGYALKGSLFYLKGNKEEAQKNWEMATRFNPDIYIPEIEVLDIIIKTDPGE